MEYDVIVLLTVSYQSGPNFYISDKNLMYGMKYDYYLTE